jgi:hypothetical protein
MSGLAGKMHSREQIIRDRPVDRYDEKTHRIGAEQIADLDQHANTVQAV